jgi:SAM-dependent methyltransferase
LPFPEKHFTHVLCRAALNYMHQRQALREMARVLRPGGLLYCHVEGPGFDWRLLRAARSGRALAGRARDLLFGIGLAALGWQPAPGSRFVGGRAFGTVRRIEKFLAQADCQVLEREVTGHRGLLPLGFRLLARRH